MPSLRPKREALRDARKIGSDKPELHHETEDTRERE